MKHCALLDQRLHGRCCCEDDDFVEKMEFCSPFFCGSGSKSGINSSENLVRSLAQSLSLLKNHCCVSCYLQSYSQHSGPNISHFAELPIQSQMQIFTLSKVAHQIRSRQTCSFTAFPFLFCYSDIQGYGETIIISHRHHSVQSVCLDSFVLMCTLENVVHFVNFKKYIFIFVLTSIQ